MIEQQNAFLEFLLIHKNLPSEEFQKIQEYLRLFYNHRLATQNEVLPSSEDTHKKNLETQSGLTPDIYDPKIKKLPNQSLEEPTRAFVSSDSGEFLFGPPPSFKKPLKERYTWKCDLGKGGMGVIQSFYDHILHREVAFKTLKKEITLYTEANDSRIHRFYKEAEIMALLEHPNIVPLYDVEETEEGERILIMRKIEGQTLSRYIKTHAHHSPAWNEIQVLSICSKICDAIAYAHSKEVIHRDLKPDNIMLGSFGEVYVMDWGIAKYDIFNPKIEDSPNDEKTKTTLKSNTAVHTIGIIGTLGYMPPEQKLQKSLITPKADIYALGKILRECYTGYSPQEEFRLLLETMSEENTNKKHLLKMDECIPSDIRIIIQKATELNPKNRYGTIQEFSRDIERYLQHQRISAILKTDKNVEQVAQEDSIQKQLKIICADEQLIPRLLAYLEKKEVQTDDYLIRQGSLAEELYFIASGLTTARLELPGEKIIQLRSMGPGAIIGEIGLYLKGKRTVSVVASKPSTVYRLSQESFQQMKEKDPKVAIVFQDYLIRTLGHRLNENSRMIETLLDEPSN
ncbi:MAG: serine/threonine-protein kinase [Planctomycetota bacterium]